MLPHILKMTDILSLSQNSSQDLKVNIYFLQLSFKIKVFTTDMFANTYFTSYLDMFLSYLNYDLCVLSVLL